MPLPEPPSRWSTGLLLSLALSGGCQRSLPRVVQRQVDSASPPAAQDSSTATAPPAGAQPPADSGWKSTTPPTFSTNGIALTADATGAATAAAATTAAVDPGLPAPRAATLSAAAATPPTQQVETPAPEIRQAQYLAAATDRDMEALRQRLGQQTQINAALTQAIVQVQRQTEAHYKVIVQVADELNARQARQDKVTEEILSLIDQMAGDAPRPIPAAGAAGGTEGAGSGAAAGGDKK